ncbi:uncharacterized protein LALA0_S05e06700g [Lachancea lanzarotensis]|uniref:LALA0S05e06700g1_1 n=1 Tax=Lachancea lanzarotensis TaxID=1245769 RepID=A0A0C7N3B2_9SACH|nr:uncharacterized protein LALA0_S05e06700g [Lachancea lanzarotensis]CEP62485.1 LALA0S05e06700g1_1 [Lachancea lanzarotensis]
MSNLFEQARERLNGSTALVPERLRFITGEAPTLGGGGGNSSGDSSDSSRGMSRTGSYSTSETDPSESSGQGSSGPGSGSDDSESLLTTGSKSGHGHQHRHPLHHHYTKRGQADSAATTNSSAFVFGTNGSSGEKIAAPPTVNSNAVSNGASMGSEAAEKAVSNFKTDQDTSN